jgi:hypothetical protein
MINIRVEINEIKEITATREKYMNNVLNYI